MQFCSDRRLCLTRDGSRVVEPEDKEAGFIFATPGLEISEEDAAKFGLDFVDGKVVLPAKKRPAKKPEGKKPEEKSAKKSEDKSAKKSEDKSAEKTGEKTPEVATARPPAPPTKPGG